MKTLFLLVILMTGSTMIPAQAQSPDDPSATSATDGTEVLMKTIPADIRPRSSADWAPSSRILASLVSRPPGT